MKKTAIAVLAWALVAMPMMAQEPEAPKPTEEEEIERAIEEAMGEQSQPAIQEESVSLAIDEAPPAEEPPPRHHQNQHREVQTLMTGSGGYGALSLGYTEVNGLPAFQMGAQAEWVIGHSFGLGIGGVGFTSDFTPVGNDYYAMSGGYGGLIMEPIIFGWFPVHMAFPIMIGGGGVASYATNADPWDYGYVDPYFGEYDWFFVAEVGAEVEFNLVRFFRLSLFGTYRWTTNLDMKPMYGLEPGTSPYPVSQQALTGWSAGVRFKFGSF